MKKNTYSLILSENVVTEIDRLAHAMNTNRSGLINRILAEYVSYETPEIRTQRIFEKLSTALSAEDAFQILPQPSMSAFQIRTALAYKYNPTVRYHVEMYRKADQSIGELRVSLRTQNTSLILYITEFFKLWSKIEHSYSPQTESAFSGGKFIKEIRINLSDEAPCPEPERYADMIFAYINALDTAMKSFFRHADRPAEATVLVEQIYGDYISNTRIPM
ncbi:MAG: hypothetical protein IJ861_06615 [Clostridia bacterium]|nr:hypothetical protein [Clostridia bacterium]